MALPNFESAVLLMLEIVRVIGEVFLPFWSEEIMAR